MIAARHPEQRPPHARLLLIDSAGRIAHAARADFVDRLRPGDLVVANDAATLPASLHGTHERSGSAIEARLAARPSLHDVTTFSAVVFGSGDHRQRTEDRPLPPPLQPGDRLEFGDDTAPLSATVRAVFGHPRFVALHLHGSPDAIWAALARHGKPVQYAHVREPLALWDVWTPIAGRAVAFEPPSAGFMLDWRSLRAMNERGIGFATLTHAAGLSSTGDAALDARFPLDEAYDLPAATVSAITSTRASGGRVVAVGTTVVRALEHAASRPGGLAAGEGIATQRLGRHSELRVVDVLLSGTHEVGSSHHELLRAFTDDDTLAHAAAALDAHGYLTHEFGDSVWLERREGRAWRDRADPLGQPGRAGPVERASDERWIQRGRRLESRR